MKSHSKFWNFLARLSACHVKTALKPEGGGAGRCFCTLTRLSARPVLIRRQPAVGMEREDTRKVEEVSIELGERTQGSAPPPLWTATPS